MRALLSTIQASGKRSDEFHRPGIHSILSGKPNLVNRSGRTKLTFSAMCVPSRLSVTTVNNRLPHAYAGFLLLGAGH